jgi:cytidylate kinase
VLVAIDGPAGAGKSTVARAVALELGFTYLDSGAMYRAVALLSLREPDRAPGVLARAHEICMRPTASPNRSSTVLVDNEDVTSAIRRQEVSDAASRVAADPAVREVLVEKQRALLSEGDWVAEGRDIGAVVAPDAGLKIFLTASAPERARRRAAELGADPDMVLAEQALRDERDSTRVHSPLQVAPGAVTLDTSELMVEDVVQRIAALARAASAAGPGWLV